MPIIANAQVEKKGFSVKKKADTVKVDPAVLAELKLLAAEAAKKKTDTLLMNFEISLVPLKNAVEIAKAERKNALKYLTKVTKGNDTIEIKKAKSALLAAEDELERTEIDNDASKKSFQSVTKTMKDIKDPKGVFVYDHSEEGLRQLLEKDGLKEIRHKDLMEKLIEDYYNDFKDSDRDVLISTDSVKFDSKASKAKKHYIFKVPATFYAGNEVVAWFGEEKLKEVKSNVKYRVDVVWSVKVKDKLKEGDSYKIAEIKLISCEAKAVSYFPSDERLAKANAQKAIKAWYANELPKLNLNEIIKDGKDWELVESPELRVEKNVSGTYPNYSCEGHKFVVQTDWSTELTDSLHLYESTIATRRLVPVFTYSVSKDGKEILSVSNWQIDKPQPPYTSSEKSELCKSADCVFDAFVADLQKFAGDPSDDSTLLMLFDPTASYAVSYKYASGKEKMKTYSSHKNLKKYLKLLSTKKATLTIKKIDTPKWTTDMRSVVYTIEQIFDSKSYKDKTIKKIKLNRDEQGQYIITEVVVDSTERL